MTSRTTSPSSRSTPAGLSSFTARGRRAPSRPAPREIPAGYRDVGQPVFIPGSMGTSSFVLAGEPGLARALLRHRLPRRRSADEPHQSTQRDDRWRELRRELQDQGIVVRCPSNKGLAEEAPFAYKDVERVVAVVERAGLARRVAQLRPLGVVKG